MSHFGYLSFGQCTFTCARIWGSVFIFRSQKGSASKHFGKHCSRLSWKEEIPVAATPIHAWIKAPCSLRQAVFRGFSRQPRRIISLPAASRNSMTPVNYTVWIRCEVIYAICLFIHGSLNEPSNSSDYIASNNMTKAEQQIEDCDEIYP